MVRKTKQQEHEVVEHITSAITKQTGIVLYRKKGRLHCQSGDCLHINVEGCTCMEVLLHEDLIEDCLRA